MVRLRARCPDIFSKRRTEVTGLSFWRPSIRGAPARFFQTQNWRRWTFVFSTKHQLRACSVFQKRRTVVIRAPARFLQIQNCRRWTLFFNHASAKRVLSVPKTQNCSNANVVLETKHQGRCCPKPTLIGKRKRYWLWFFRF